MGQSPPDKSTFVRLLGELDHSEFEAFVADLLVARGWEVQQTDGLMFLGRDAPTAEQRKVAVWRGGASLTSLADTIDMIATRAPASRPLASTARELEATLIDTTDLYRLCLYGIDREDADTLFQRYFDRRLREARQEPAREATGKSIDRRRASSWRSGGWFGVLAAALVTLGIVVALGAASGPLGAFEGGSGPQPAVVANGTAEPVTDPFSATPVPLPSTAADQGESEMRQPMDEERYLDLHPTCERPPAMVVSIILGALRNDQLSTKRGIETAWRFSVNPRRSNNGYRLFVNYLSQDKFASLFVHQAVEYARPVRHTESIVTQRVRLTTSDRRVAYVFALSKSEGGSDAGCWKLAGIQGPTNG